MVVIEEEERCRRACPSRIDERGEERRDDEDEQGDNDGDDDADGINDDDDGDDDDANATTIALARWGLATLFRAQPSCVRVADTPRASLRTRILGEFD